MHNADQFEFKNIKSMIKKINSDTGAIEEHKAMALASTMKIDVPRDKPVTSSGAITDDSIIPWGKYKGIRMQDVPVDYLHYVWHHFVGKHTEPIKQYIKDNLDALKMENPDLIWK